MLKILDWYILKRYLGTFFVMLLMFVPIGIVVNLAERISKILENKAPLNEVVIYYYDFTVYFAHMLFPIFIFLSIIWFTSKLANNTEIVAFLSSGVSYNRFLRPYIYGASIVAILSLALSLYFAPMASKGFNEFNYKYITPNRKVASTEDVYKQINDNDFIFVSYFDAKNRRGTNFTLEHFEDNQLKYKMFANSIRYIEEDSTFRLVNYFKRSINDKSEVLHSKRTLDTVLNFRIEDLAPASYLAETLLYGELNDFIEKEKQRGSSNIGRYELVKYKKFSLPISVYILTLIAVAVSSMKRRGGMGLNLAFGITIAMVYVFFDKIFGVLVQKANFSPILAVWIPNVIFGVLAYFLLRKARR